MSDFEQIIHADSLIRELVTFLLAMKSDFQGVKNTVSNIIKNHNLTKNEIIMIHIISSKPHLTVNELAESLNLSKSTVVIRLNDLENKEMTYRIRNEIDKRIVRIDLTEKGRSVADEINLNPFSNFIQKAKTLNQEDIDHFTHILQLFNQDFSKDAFQELQINPQKLQEFLGISCS